MRFNVIVAAILVHMFIASHVNCMSSVETKMSHEAQQPFSTNTLLIFLDDSEKEMGPVSRILLEALRQQAAPILASMSLLRVIFLTSKDSLLKTDFENEWAIKLVNADLALLTPKNYIQTMQDKYGSRAKAASFSSLEAVLGLQIDHMKTVSSLQEYAKKWVPDLDYFGFIEDLNEIFVPRTAYAPEKTAQNIGLTNTWVPTWSFFVNGHGELGKSIVGIPLKQFRPFLDFLANKINTKLLVYFSCYAAGTNAALIYGDLTAPTEYEETSKTASALYKNKTYPFVIATGALTDAPTSGIAVLFNFKDFVRQVTAPDNGDYTKMLMPVLRSAQGMVEQEPFALETRGDIRNVPQLKLPGLPWFNVVDTTKRVVSIGKTLAQARTQDLDIISYFKVNKPLGILLYTSYIPFTLNINLDAMPPLILMEPGEDPALEKPSQPAPMVYIKGISINGTLDNFLQAFDIIKQAETKKTFWIESLTIEANKASKKIVNNFIIKFDIKGFTPTMEVYSFTISNQDVEGTQYNLKSQQWKELSSVWAKNYYRDFLYDKKNDPAFEEIHKKIAAFEKIKNIQDKKVKTESAETRTTSNNMPQLLSALEQALLVLSL